jgi:hypothetical protein
LQDFDENLVRAAAKKGDEGLAAFHRQPKTPNEQPQGNEEILPAIRSRISSRNGRASICRLIWKAVALAAFWNR